MFEFIARFFFHRRRHIEYTSPGAGWFFDIDRTLWKGHSRWQRIEVAESRELGKALILDGITQLTARGEYQYHEPMAHVTLLSHPEPEHVLVIGGGDGALVREILRHPTIRSVELVELDRDVVEFCRSRLPEVGGMALDDPRVRVRIGDGRAFAREAMAGGKRYDAIFMDMTDPSGPSLALYTREFFAIVRDLLADGSSVFAMHTESPDCRPRVFAKIYATLRAEFPRVTPFVSHVRMYGGQWSWALCRNSPDIPDPISADLAGKRIVERGLSGLRIVSEATWPGLFALWPEYRYLLSSGKAPQPATDNEPEYPD